MSDAIADALLQHGFLGIALAALGTAFWKQSADLKAAQDARTEDAKKVVSLVLELVEKQNEALGELTQALREWRSSMDSRKRD